MAKEAEIQEVDIPFVYMFVCLRVALAGAFIWVPLT